MNIKKSEKKLKKILHIKSVKDSLKKMKHKRGNRHRKTHRKYKTKRGGGKTWNKVKVLLKKGVDLALSSKTGRDQVARLVDYQNRLG